MKLELPAPDRENFPDRYADAWYAENRRLENEAMSSYLLTPEPQKLRDLLEGQTVRKIGDCPYTGYLAIDYDTPDGLLKRTVVGYTELGYWVQWHGDRKA